MARSLLVLLLAACATAFQAPARSTSRALRVDAFGKKAPAAPPAKDKKDMSAWDVYTEGEYGQAFKFPWEVEASDKTAIGHVLPIAITVGILGYARFTQGV
mmetsp:Transcript_14033/g.48296  ORF Transcript_14033/g.48296 Transcript_14033/m.48296 type:complete len:101 (+) Transcript_14033:119-421(+)